MRFNRHKGQGAAHQGWLCVMESLTFNPDVFRSSLAAARPAAPAPMMITSNSCCTSNSWPLLALGTTFKACAKAAQLISVSTRIGRAVPKATQHRLRLFGPDLVAFEPISESSLPSSLSESLARGFERSELRGSAAESRLRLSSTKYSDGAMFIGCLVKCSAKPGYSSGLASSLPPRWSRRAAKVGWP